MINIKGHEIPNTVDELTVEQFDRLNKINTEELDQIDSWIKKFSYLGVPEEIFEDMPIDEFKTAVKEFNEVGEYPTERVLTVEVDGFHYSAKETIGVKDLSLIEKAWKADRSEFTADCLSILFKRDDLGKAEHYASSHIKHKKALFKKLPCKLALPHVIAVSEILVKSAEKLNEPTEELAGN